MNLQSKIAGGSNKNMHPTRYRGRLSSRSRTASTNFVADARVMILLAEQKNKSKG